MMMRALVNATVLEHQLGSGLTPDLRFELGLIAVSVFNGEVVSSGANTFWKQRN